MAKLTFLRCQAENQDCELDPTYVLYDRYGALVGYYCPGHGANELKRQEEREMNAMRGFSISSSEDVTTQN